MSNVKISNFTAQTNVTLLDGFAAYEGAVNKKISGSQLVASLETNLDLTNFTTITGGAAGQVLTIDALGTGLTWDNGVNSVWPQIGAGIYTSFNVGIGGTPVTTAVLSCTSTSKGFLPPRMTEVQMNAISGPVEGLMVFDTTNKQWKGYDGTSWVIIG